MRSFILFISFLSYQLMLSASAKAANTSDVSIKVEKLEYGNQYRFTLKDPPTLTQVFEENKPYWTYYWEFGDGTFDISERSSTLEHIFPAYKASYTIKIYLSPHYAYEKPITISKKIEVRGTFIEPPVLPAFQQLQIITNQEPVFEHEMRCVLQYGLPTSDKPTDGDSYLLFFYNDEKFGEPFEFENDYSQFYFGEKEIGRTRKELINKIRKKYGGLYFSQKIWNVGHLEAGETRNLFFSLLTGDVLENFKQSKLSILAILVSGNMLSDKDLKLSSLKDSPYMHKLEFKIKKALDPNRIDVNRPVILSNPLRKNLSYKVQFENKGDAGAQTVRVAVKLPAYFRENSLSLVDNSLDCGPCNKADIYEACLDIAFTSNRNNIDSVIFTFRNVYVAGKKEMVEKEEGFQKVDKSNTRGWIAYTLSLDGSLIHPLSYEYQTDRLTSQARITFNQLEYLNTNKTRTRLVQKRRYIKIGQNLPLWNQGELALASTFKRNSLIDNLSIGLGYTLAESKGFHIDGEVQYSGIFLKDITAGNFQFQQLSMDQLEANLSIHRFLATRTKLIGNLNFGLGIGLTLLLATNDEPSKTQRPSASVTFRNTIDMLPFYYELLPKSSFTNNLDPLGFHLYAEVRQNIMGERLGINLRYYASRKSGQFQQDTFRFTYFYPELSLVYRVGDAKSKRKRYLERASWQ